VSNTHSFIRSSLLLKIIFQLLKHYSYLQIQRTEIIYKLNGDRQTDTDRDSVKRFDNQARQEDSFLLILSRE